MIASLHEETNSMNAPYLQPFEASKLAVTTDSFRIITGSPTGHLWGSGLQISDIKSWDQKGPLRLRNLLGRHRCRRLHLRARISFIEASAIRCSFGPQVG